MTIRPRRRRLREPTTPILGESARGLVCRALGDHRVPRTWNVLRLVGLRHRNRVSIAEDAELDIDELAWLIRVDAPQLRERCYPAMPEKRRSFFGMEVPGRAIEDRTRRFSPASLAASRHLRALWELRDLPFCGESWELLVDACRCGVVQRFVRLNGVHRCDDCGRPLSLTQAGRVPDELQTSLSLAVGIASPLDEDREAALRRLPEPIRQVDRAAVWQTIMRLRRALAGEGFGLDADLRAFADACQAVLDWPIGIRSLKPGPGTPKSTWRTAMKAYASLGPSASIPATGPTAGPVPCGNRPPPNPRVPRRRTRQRSGLIGLRPAFELTRLAPETLLLAREQGRLTRHERRFGERLLPAFDPDELLAFAESHHGRLTAWQAGARLGIGSWAVEDIARSDLLATDPVRPDEMCFHPDAVVRLEASIEAAARALPEDAVPLHRALLSVWGREKPWAGVAAAMLDGRLPFDLATGHGPVFARVRVRPDAVGVLAGPRLPARRPFARRVVKQHALEILNTRFGSHYLDGLPAEGTNPLRYTLDDVLRLAARAISSTEIGWRLGRPLRRPRSSFRDVGIAQIADDLWSRADFEAAVRRGLV